MNVKNFCGAGVRGASRGVRRNRSSGLALHGDQMQEQIAQRAVALQTMQAVSPAVPFDRSIFDYASFSDSIFA